MADEMNSAENEQNPNRTEAKPHREAVEVSSSEQNHELQKLLENHKNERIQAVGSETEAAVLGSSKRLESAASFGYTPEQLQVLRQEHGVDAQLEQNQQRIEAAGMDARTRLEAIRLEAIAAEAPVELNTPESAEDGIEKEKTIEQFQEKRGSLLTNVLTSEITSNGLDLVPFAGGGKMLVESISGKTLSGQKLQGKERIIHAAMGAGSLALDFTGIGEISKGGVLVGKSVGLMEKAGARLAERGAIKGAKIFLATSEFMAKHPELTAKAERFAEVKIREQIQNIKDYRAQAA